MHRINIKPLSVNEAYRGRRFATQELKQYKNDLALLLPKLDIPNDRPLQVSYRFGLSNKNADGDNLIKAFQDIIADAYGFNDRQIWGWQVWKTHVKKGEEFVEFEITY